MSLQGNGQAHREAKTVEGTQLLPEETPWEVWFLVLNYWVPGKKAPRDEIHIGHLKVHDRVTEAQDKKKPFFIPLQKLPDSSKDLSFKPEL